MSRWWVAALMLSSTGVVSAAGRRFEVRAEVFDSTGASTALSTTKLEVTEGQAGSTKFAAGDRRIDLKAVVGRAVADDPECRPLELVVRESRQIPDRFVLARSGVEAIDDSPIAGLEGQVHPSGRLARRPSTSNTAR